MHLGIWKGMTSYNHSLSTFCLLPSKTQCQLLYGPFGSEKSSLLKCPRTYLILWSRTEPNPGKSSKYHFEGIVNNGDLVADSADVWRQILNVNVVAASLCTQLAVNLMIEKGFYFLFILKIQTQSNGFSCFLSVTLSFSFKFWTIRKSDIT